MKVVLKVIKRSMRMKQQEQKKKTSAKPKAKNLKLNKQTLKDLTPDDPANVKGATGDARCNPAPSLACKGWNTFACGFKTALC